MDCYICLTAISEKKRAEGTYISCSSDRCDNHLCVNCLVEYLRRCRAEGQLPVCPIKQCRKHFRIKDLTDLDDVGGKVPLRLYENAVFSYYLGKTEKAVNKRINEVNLLEKMQKERERFIKDHFPRAIYKTALIALPKKIRDVKKLKEASDVKTRNYSISCRATGCIGVLDENYTCTICETAFCPDCDRIITDGEHECEADDLASMETLKKTVKCPKCKTPVERSEGCDNMTCAACGENFLYSTGESGGLGGHSHYVGRETVSFYDSVSDLIDKSKKPNLFTRLICEIEECRPQLAKARSDPGVAPDLGVTKHEKRIESIIFRYRQDALSKKEAKRMVITSFKAHCIQLESYRTYLRHIDEIETGLRQGTLTAKVLRQIWEQYCDDDD